MAQIDNNLPPNQINGPGALRREPNPTEVRQAARDANRRQETRIQQEEQARRQQQDTVAITVDARQRIQADRQARAGEARQNRDAVRQADAQAPAQNAQGGNRQAPAADPAIRAPSQSIVNISLESNPRAQVPQTDTDPIQARRSAPDRRTPTVLERQVTTAQADNRTRERRNEESQAARAAQNEVRQNAVEDRRAREQQAQQAAEQTNPASVQTRVGQNVDRLI